MRSGSNGDEDEIENSVFDGFIHELIRSSFEFNESTHNYYSILYRYVYGLTLDSH